MLSRPDCAEPVFHRRRRCAECRRIWPTCEALDVVRFKRELRAHGLRLADLGLPEE